MDSENKKTNNLFYKKTNPRIAKNSPSSLSAKDISPSIDTAWSKKTEQAAGIVPSLTKLEKTIRHAKIIFKDLVTLEDNFRTAEPMRNEGQLVVNGPVSSIEASKQWAKSISKNKKISEKTKEAFTHFYSKLETLTEYSKEIEKKLVAIHNLTRYEEQIEAFERFVKGDLFQGYLSFLEGRGGLVDLRASLIALNKDHPSLIPSFEKASLCLVEKAQDYQLAVKEITAPFGQGKDPIEGIPSKVPALASSITKAMRTKKPPVKASNSLPKAKSVLNKIERAFAKSHLQELQTETKGIKITEPAPSLQELENLVSTILNQGTLHDVQKLKNQLVVLAESSWGKAPIERAFIEDLQAQTLEKVEELAA
jgi:hypothetical protein